MTFRNSVVGLTAFALLAIGPVIAPAGAQRGSTNSDTTANESLNKTINLDVKSGNLFYAITLLFDQLHVGNYILPEPLKNIEVSAHFTDLPIRTALDVLLKNSGFTYKVEGSVYSVVPKIEESKPDVLPPDTTNKDRASRVMRIYRIPSNTILFNAIDLITMLGGRILPGSMPGQIIVGGSGTGGAATGGFGSGGLGSGLGGGTGGLGGAGGGGSRGNGSGQDGTGKGG